MIASACADAPFGQEPDMSQLVGDDGGEVTGISGLAAIQSDDRYATFHVEVPNSADLAVP